MLPFGEDVGSRRTLAAPYRHLFGRRQGTNRRPADMPQLSHIRKLRRHMAPTCREIFVNRSQRRAAVVRRSIAAGLLCAGFGAAAASPAMADAGDDTGGAVASNNDAVRRGLPAVADSAAGNASPRPRRGVRTPPTLTDDEWHPHPDWCEFVWPQWPIDPPLPYTGNRNGIIAQFLLGQTTGTVATAGIADAGEHVSTAVGAPEAPPEATPPAAIPEPSGQALSIATPPATLGAPPAVALPPAQRPESVEPAPIRVPASLPDLPSASLGDLAAVALPGLAGIAALTALGGFLGYRQAKAGYVLRAAGTARFLQ